MSYRRRPPRGLLSGLADVVAQVVAMLPSAGSLRKIGFWQSPDEPQYPRVQSMVDWSWDRSHRAEIVKYLRGARRGDCYYGYSNCRICGQQNGSCDLTDGVYVWPEGFAHYVESHGVRPPIDFIEHVVRTKWRTRR
jgi:hypothetical protein